MRKAFLALMLGLVLITSGCMGETSSNPSEENERPEPVNNSDEDTGEDEDMPPNLTVVSFDTSREEALLGENVTLEAKVRNSGGEGLFYEGISISRGKFDFEDPSGVHTFNGSVGAGETRSFSWESEASSIGTWRYHMKDNFTATFSTVPRNLSLGESYVNERDLSMTVEDFELKDSYMADGSENSEAGKQYLFLEYSVRNQGDGSVSALSDGAIFVLAGGERYENSYYAEDASSYEEFDSSGDPLPAGETRTGYLAYKIPGNLERSDITIFWNEDIGFDSKETYWHR
jgi:hypothetical protein